MQRIKIVYVIAALEVGGAERQLAELVTRLDARRFQPVVCCLSAGGAWEAGLRARGIRLEVIARRRGGADGRRVGTRHGDDRRAMAGSGSGSRCAE